MMKLTKTGLRHGLMALLLAPILLSGCSTNPVTGKREVVFQSENWDRKVGAQQYLPARQMQGGDYVVDPALTSYLQSVGNRLAAFADHTGEPFDYEFIVLNSSVPNAWALPGGKIAFNRGLLLELESEAELAAVMGHEIVHSAARHGAKGVTRGMLLQGGLLATALATQKKDYSRYAVGAAQVGAQLLNQRYGRSAELESDKYGMAYMSRAGYDPKGAVDLQKTFVRLSQGRQQNWLSGLFASHPPSQQRVDENLKTAEGLPKNGKLGREEYQQRIAYIKKTKPAYDSYDKGRKALGDGDARQALQLANQALAIEPREALFYGLRGDIDYAQKNYQRAVNQYSEALEHNPQYFKFYLGRGESYRNLNRLDLAERDLTASAKLLPTADALYGLGQIAESQGNVNKAMQYYANVVGENPSQSPALQTPAGKASYERMVTLDLPRNPGKYVSVRRNIDQKGRVYLELANRAPTAVGNVQVAFAYVDGNGRQRQEQRVHRRAIPPGQGAIVMLGTEYAPLINNMQVAVRAAKIAR